MGPRAGVDRCGKSRPPPGFDPRTVQPVASRYTDDAIRRYHGKSFENIGAAAQYKLELLSLSPQSCLGPSLQTFCSVTSLPLKELKK